MKQVFKQREDNTIDFIDSILVADEIPQGYVEIPKEDEGRYNSDGRRLTDAELAVIRNAPQPKTELEQLKEQQQLMQSAIDELIFGGVL